MKKILSFLLNLVLAFGVAGCSGTSGGSSAADEPYVEPETERIAPETESIAEETAAEPEQETIVTETKVDTLGTWAAAYQNYLLKVLPDIYIDESAGEYIRFGFIYLNNDDVPELWYNDSMGAHGPNYVICTCRDGKVSRVADGFTMLDYYKKQGVFFFTASGGAAAYDVTYYKMTKDGSTQLDMYVEYLDTSAPPDSDGNMTVVRQLNDVDISEEEHQAFLDQYTARYGQSTSVESDDGFPLTEENILAHCK